MLKQIVCVLLSVVAVNSVAGCVDADPPETHPLVGGWIESPPCVDCSLVHAQDEADVTIVLDRDGFELCRVGPRLDTCGVR